jgi:hypothetical protein
MGQGGELVSTKINRRWQEPIASEQQALGCENKAECMDKILGFYFGQKTNAGSDERKGEARANMGEGTAAEGSKGTVSAENSQEAIDLARQVGELTASLAGAQREAERWQAEAQGNRTELEAWQTMEKHAPVPQILEHLSSCPNCQPELQGFLDRFVITLPPNRVKELARQQKWWPPPPIELPTRKGRS